MPGIISYETNDGGIHTIASVDPSEISGLLERSTAFVPPAEIKVHDLTTPEGAEEAVDDIAVAATVVFAQIGNKLGRSLSWEALGNYRHEAKTRRISDVEQARDLGHVIVTLTAPKEAVDVILSPTQS
jgi:hypothetical protein